MSDAPRPQITADPNVFAAHVIAGLEAGGFKGDFLGMLKLKWHMHRRFIEWVNDGGDKIEWAQIQAKERAATEKQEAIKAADKAAEDARREANRVAFGAKITA